MATRLWLATTSLSQATNNNRRYLSRVPVLKVYLLQFALQLALTVVELGVQDQGFVLELGLHNQVQEVIELGLHNQIQVLCHDVPVLTLALCHFN